MNYYNEIKNLIVDKKFIRKLKIIAKIEMN